jgi:sugar phosphate isomerase/epimerase
MNMRTNRRNFLKSAGLGVGTLGLLTETALQAAKSSGKSASFLVKPPKMKLGMVTYNLGQDWDVETIIKNCEAASFQGVELRTSHAHKVELNLSPEQRAQVKKRFQDSKVELMGLGSTYDFHTPDQAKLKKDIAEAKEYIVLAHDVGAPGIKVRPNGLPKEVPKEKTLEQIGHALRELGEFGEGYGVVVRLEMHGSETSRIPNIKAILDAANHKNVGGCWNSNATDLEGEGFDYNFNLVKDKIIEVHMRDLCLEDYPFRKLLTRLNEIGFSGYCLAEIPQSADPVRVMKYYRALWLAYQGLL